MNRSLIHSTSIFLACFGIISGAFAKDTATLNNADHLQITKQISKSYSQIAKKAIPAVVSIKTQYSSKKMRPQGGGQDPFNDPTSPFNDDFWYRFFGQPGPQQKMGGFGSGFLISPDGYIITNNHLANNTEKMVVTLQDKREFDAKLIGSDPSTDIALIKIEGSNFPFLPLGNSDTLEQGELVMAIGNPLGFNSSISTGVISALRRNELNITPREEFIQIDAAINRGNSGGPVLNLDGEVIGMATAIVSTNGGGFMGIGFAVPSNLLRHITDQLKTNGKVTLGYIGIAPQTVDANIAENFNLKKAEGALVAQVVKNSPADKSGLLPGDIIVKVNDKNIDNAGSLKTIISLMKTDEKANLIVKRGDKELTLVAVVGVHPESEVSVTDVQDKLGILVQELTPDIREEYNLGSDDGVVIKFVSPDSLAADIGLRPGMMILSVNRVPVKTPADFYSKVQEFASKKQILLHIKAGSQYRFITLKIE